MHEKGLQRQEDVGPLVSSQSASRPGDKPLKNRLSTGRCGPPSVYIGFRLFVLLAKCSRNVSSMPWGVRRTLVSWANCSVGVPSCPVPPRRPAVRPDPTLPWYVRVLDSTRCVSSECSTRHVRKELPPSTLLHPISDPFVEAGNLRRGV